MHEYDIALKLTGFTVARWHNVELPAIQNQEVVLYVGRAAMRMRSELGGPLFSLRKLESLILRLSDVFSLDELLKPKRRSTASRAR